MFLPLLGIVWYKYILDWTLGKENLNVSLVGCSGYFPRKVAQLQWGTATVRHRWRSV